MKMKRIHLLVLACISLSNNAMAQDSYTVLAADKSHLTISNKECIEASHGNLLQITPMGNTDNRYYQIKQFSDWYEYNYGYTLKEQIAERKIIGKRICNGVVTLSDMELPFAKKAHAITDANDGMLLIETVQRSMNEIKDVLNKMHIIAETASTGNQSSSQLSNLDITFQSLLNEVNRIAETSSFNGIDLLNGWHPIIDIPIDHKNGKLRISLPNLTTGNSGLNISGLQVNAIENAQAALALLPKTINTIDKNLAQLHANEPALKAAIKRLGVITSFDLNGEIFTVKRYPQTTQNS